MLVCDKIYNMSDENMPQESQYPTEPSHISDAIDAVMYELANPIEMRSAIDSLIDRQTALYQEHRAKREQGESLGAEDEKELEELSFALLSLKQLYEKYGQSDQ